MRYSLALIPLGILIAFLGLVLCIKKDENLQRVEQGSASKIFYQNHSYVVWSINSGGGIVHDPDCQCNNK
jgi:hypothetical protein